MAFKLFGYEISKGEKRSATEEVQNFSPFSNMLSFGSYLDNSSAMCLSAVYRAVEIISDSIALLPVRVKINNSNHKEIVEQHPLNLLFKDGIRILDRYNFIKLLVQSVLLKGNGFAYIERGAGGTPKSLLFLESGDVTINYNKQKKELSYTCATASNRRIPPSDMIHLVKNSWDGINGVSVLSYARRIIDIANNTENSAKSFFSNGCNLAGIISVQGQLTEKQKQDIRANWQQTYNGSATNGCLLGVMQGNMSYTPIQINASDAQMLESRQYNVQDIARFFGISPILLGDLSHSGYGAIEAMQQQFLLHTLQPYIVLIEQEFSRKLLSPSESNLEVNLDETVLLRTDKTAQADYYQKMLASGILCIDEVRKEMGLSEIGLTDHVIPYTDVNANKLNGNGGEQDENQ